MAEAMELDVEERDEVVVEAEHVDALEQEDLRTVEHEVAVEPVDGGDPWEGASDLARRHQLVPGTITYRHKHRRLIDGRVVERRAAVNPSHAQQKWEWRLGAEADEADDQGFAQGLAQDVAPSDAPGPRRPSALEMIPDGVEDLAPDETVGEMSRDLEDVRAELEAKAVELVKARKQLDATRSELADRLRQVEAQGSLISAAGETQATLMREVADAKARLADARGFIDTQRARLEKADAVVEQLAQERVELQARLATEGTILRLDIDGWGALQRLAGMLDTLERAADGGARKAAAMMVETLDAVLEGGAA